MNALVVVVVVAVDGTWRNVRWKIYGREIGWTQVL